MNDEPFRTYSWLDMKWDNDRLMAPHREHRIRVAAWREFGMTLITVALAFSAALPLAIAAYA